MHALDTFSGKAVAGICGLYKYIYDASVKREFLLQNLSLIPHA